VGVWVDGGCYDVGVCCEGVECGVVGVVGYD